LASDFGPRRIDPLPPYVVPEPPAPPVERSSVEPPVPRQLGRGYVYLVYTLTLEKEVDRADLVAVTRECYVLNIAIKATPPWKIHPYTTTDLKDRNDVPSWLTLRPGDERDAMRRRKIPDASRPSTNGKRTNAD